MMNKRLIITGLALCMLVATATGAGDTFEKIKKELAGAEFCRMEFLSILESEVFQSVDTTQGHAYFAVDGRYVVKIGPDTYLYDNETLYSYSETQNQVTVERLAPSQARRDDVSFVTRLDDYYETFPVTPNAEYRLVKTVQEAESIPDSLRLFVNGESGQLDRIEFIDLNEDINRIIFLDVTVSDICDTAMFIPQFPDSVETIRL